MPTPFWRHPCCDPPGTASSEKVCSEMRSRGQFDGWYLVKHEGMARYQYVYGLVAIGPHRPLAERAVRRHAAQCEACEGTGILSLSEREWRPCAACEATGGFWLISPEEVEAIRARVLEQYPEGGGAVPADPVPLRGPDREPRDRAGGGRGGGLTCWVAWSHPGRIRIFTQQGASAPRIQCEIAMGGLLRAS